MASPAALRGAGRFRLRHAALVFSSPAGAAQPAPRRALATARTNPGVLANLSAAALTVAGAAGTLFFVAYAGDSRAGIYKWMVMPLMHSLLDAEDAHRVSIRSARAGLCPKDTWTEPESLRVEVERAKLGLIFGASPRRATRPDFPPLKRFRLNARSFSAKPCRARLALPQGMTRMGRRLTHC
ncbi:MAG: hypothetical protein BJ554DRAFT_7675 [Olpidium bornovanus]|uniref:Uncharacterized protein n=1 Tax=Olpidium bornovanus TaxID=278681 RepID=A0A8H7ZWI6_9FUNG|nr:MAG: hypothetical protein BJ554DRAFT_7675 [Olpidium bornovanus]